MMEFRRSQGDTFPPLLINVPPSMHLICNLIITYQITFFAFLAQKLWDEAIQNKKKIEEGTYFVAL